MLPDVALFFRRQFRPTRSGVLAVVTLAALTVSACASRSSVTKTSGSEPASATTATSTASATNPSTATPTPTATASKGPSTTSTTLPPDKPGQVSAATATKTSASIKRLSSYLGHGGVSIEAVDLDTGATYRYGATSGMRTGSIVKLYILETVMLRHQKAGTKLSEDERELATKMIENSDNNAATALWNEIGGGSGLRKAAAELGVKNTVPDPDGRWGLTQTDAPDYIALLRNLTSDRALSSSSRKYILELMEDVEADQRWGVSAAADKGTTVRLKNGWLATDSDHDLWLVNSVGVITAHGDKVIVAVMTQHGSSFTGGISLVQKLAKLSVGAVTAS
jgi:beta-lactamase class A